MGQIFNTKLKQVNLARIVTLIMFYSFLKNKDKIEKVQIFELNYFLGKIFFC